MDIEAIKALPSFRHLRCFALAVELGGIGRAAEEIGMSQPAASNAIAQLEDLFGVALIVRNTGGNAPSLAGASLHVRTRRFLALLTEGLSEVCLEDARRTRLLAAIRRVHVSSLIAIAESGTFTSAAKYLGISGSALHRAAREFEKLLRCPLFQIHPDGIGVNSAGEALARMFRLAAQEMVQAHEELGQYKEISAAKITLGVLPLLPKRWIARVIARAILDYPGVAIELQEGNHAALVKDLRWGALDLIVGALPPSPSEEDITQEPLFKDPYVLVVRRGHPLTKARALNLQMLTEHDWVVPSHNLPRRAALERFFDTLPSRPRIWLDTSSPGTMIAVMEETDCITVLSRTQLFTDGAPNLEVLPVKFPDSGRKVGITRRRDWLPTPAQKSLLAALTETMPLAMP